MCSCAVCVCDSSCHLCVCLCVWGCVSERQRRSDIWEVFQTDYLWEICHRDPVWNELDMFFIFHQTVSFSFICPLFSFGPPHPYLSLSLSLVFAFLRWSERDPWCPFWMGAVLPEASGGIRMVVINCLWSVIKASEVSLFVGRRAAGDSVCGYIWIIIIQKRRHFLQRVSTSAAGETRMKWFCWWQRRQLHPLRHIFALFSSFKHTHMNTQTCTGAWTNVRTHTLTRTHTYA